MSYAAAELAARSSYGRILAYLAAWSRDVTAAEDALGEAFLEAVGLSEDRAVREFLRDGFDTAPECA